MITQLIRKPHNKLPEVERFRILWWRSIALAATSFVLIITQIFIIPRDGGISEVLFPFGGIIAVAALVCAGQVIFLREPARAWSFTEIRCAYLIALGLTAASCALLITTLLAF